MTRPVDPTRERMTRRGFLLALGSAGAGAALLSCAGGRPSVQMREAFDLIVRGGMVLDGTGSPAFSGDLGIRNGTILAVGNLEEATAARMIDARGLTVCPGFIDIHSHVDLELFRDPRAESKVMQGVTTEVSGMDGDSPAPLGGPNLERSLKGFEERFGFACPYRDMDGFLTALERNHSAQNIVMFVGLGTVREVSVGLDDRPPTAEEMEAMKRELVKAVEQGCMGVSSGLEYTPGSFATTEELSELMRIVPERSRIYATHMRNEDDAVLEAIDEALTIARRSGSSLQVSHLKAQNRRNWPKQQRALAMLESARREGLDVHADRYPYVAFSTGLTNLFPIWSREGGTEAFLERLTDPASRGHIREYVERKVRGLGSWDAVMISSVRLEDDKQFQGRTMQEICYAASADPFEFAVELLQREKGSVGMVGFGMNEEGTEKVLAWRHTMVASDGGAYSPSRPTSAPHPRSYGTFPRAIALYQRERNITTLPEMVRKMSGLPAEKLGLRDRGRLAPRLAADLVVFDYGSIRDRATFENPHQFPEGIFYVIVNGVPVVDGGEQTSALPGQVLRRS